MIDRQALLSDLQTLLKRVEGDLLARSESDEVPEVGQRLREEYERAKEAQRTAQNYEDWRSDAITQAAAAWVLSCVFVRFLEDNRLIDPPKIAGAGKRLQQARDEWELYLSAAKQPNERDYLLSVLDELAALPGTKDVFGPLNPIRELPNWLSGDAARDMLGFFQKIDANSPESNKLIHDFTDPTWETRFLGDLYQDLSEAARKKYALLQTPEFVEEFILDRTLEPALDEFGQDGSLALGLGSSEATSAGGSITKPQDPRPKTSFRMIDPACGSGHFLLGTFPRILRRWQKKEPGAKIRDLVQRTLDSIHGVDVNPYAVAIARFRLLLTAMRAEGLTRLADAAAYTFHLAVGDSLMHGAIGGDQLSLGWRDVDHTYHAEDPKSLRRLLAPGHYHAVVANPPYITPKDRGLNEEYRRRYPKVCHMKYSLAVPFMQRLFDLACVGGFTGQITANSFMKREFGKKLIEQFLPTVDLTHVIDTSGAYIPGHGTPTVILFGRNRKPVGRTLRAVMGIRGEPSTPDDPSHGRVWSAIVAQIDQPGSQSEFVSAGNSPREAFQKHPWSIGGGGAAELKEQLEESAEQTLIDLIDEVGVLGMTNADEVMLAPGVAIRRQSVEAIAYRRLALGDDVRDWLVSEGDSSLFPYRDERLIPIRELPRMERWLWPARTVLGNRATFARLTYFQEGRPWWEWHQVTLKRLRTPLTIVYGEVATHNHFVLDRGGKVFKQTAPVIKLPAEATEDDHLALVGLLNSSTACFWMRQTCFPKGGHGIGRGIQDEAWESRFAFNGTALQELPLPTNRPTIVARHLDNETNSRRAYAPCAVLRCDISGHVSEVLHDGRRRWELSRKRMIALQEELDWLCYRLYGILDTDLTYSGDLPPLELGHRAFEIVLGRKMAKGESRTAWFDRHGSTPITELPADWPEDYKRLVERRIELIQADRNISLIEQPEYKRRWNTESWDSQLERALRIWLLDRLESYFDFDGRMNDDGELTAKLDVVLTSLARLADIARQDADFMQVGEVYRDDSAFDVERLVVELVVAESVPLLPVLRYKPSGLRKRAEWERAWELQREEDRLALGTSDLGFQGSDAATQGQRPTAEARSPKPEAQSPRFDIPVPPKYTSADFLKSDYWRLRGKLDVPKERWVSFPHCEGPDGMLVIAWAGYDHLQLSRAISAYYVDIQQHLGGRDDPRLVPLLACLLELLPWIKQWHNEPDAAFDGMCMGDYFEGFINEEARQLGKTIPEIKAWEPEKKGKRRS